MDRFEAVSNLQISTQWLYKLNSCGLKDNFLDIKKMMWGTNENKKCDDQTNNNEDNEQNSGNKMLIWMSIVLRFFDVYFNFH